MSAPLGSSSWYRVAERRPKLRSHARLFRHLYRGSIWHLLQDPASARVHRFSPAARFVIGLCDGRRTVGEIAEIAGRRFGDDGPTQDEIIQLLGQLHTADLLQSDVTPDVAEVFGRGQTHERAQQRRSFSNPMAIRISIWDPDRFLNRIAPLLQWIWSRWGAVLWTAVVLPALLLVPSHWTDLTHNFADRILALDQLALMALVFPVLKVMHEFGHASAVKAGRGEVHDLGLLFLVLLPVPYVEASASTVFKSRIDRAIVGAAGVAVELFIAALAFYVWLAVEPGLVRSLLFQVIVIATVSTLLFNGNPLLRYDAYYVLVDLAEIPNLGTRSLQYWGYLLERYLLGVRDLEPPESSPGEKVWFLFYGAASTVYRIFVTVAIALFIATRFFFIGVVLALWAVAAMAVLPVVKGMRHIGTSPRLRRHRTRAVLVSAGTAVGLLAVLFLVPAPSHSHAEGVMWISDQAAVRAGASGFFGSFIVEPGSAVAEGEALTRSYDAMLDARLKIHLARVAELEAQYLAENVTDRAKAQITREKLQAEKANGTLLRERAEDLIGRAGSDGIFRVAQSGDMPGRFYKKGELLGYVVGQAPPVARVVVPQDSIERVRDDTRRIRIRLIDRPDVVYEGLTIRETPAAAEFLPSKALAAEGGGEIAIDPRETKGPKSLQRMFQFDIGIAGLDGVDHFGQRVFVRFEHAPEPLGFQWWRSLRLLFLSSFNV